ncbi:MAG: sulfite exporter TauE/SafE family protein [Bacillota bacterium]
MFDYTWFLAAVVVILASGLQSITGFGFGVTAVPLFLIFLDAKTSVSLSVVISFFSVSILAHQVRESLSYNLVKNILIGAAIGIPMGVYVFYHFNLQSLKLLISIAVIIISFILFTGYRFKIKEGRAIDICVGIISGIMTPSMGMPGPPVVLFFNNKQVEKSAFRATFAFYNAVVYVPSILFMLFLGSLSKIFIIKALSLVPVALIGGYIGRKIFPHVPQEYFQKGVPLFVFITAMYSLIGG